MYTHIYTHITCSNRYYDAMQRTKDRARPEGFDAGGVCFYTKPYYHIYIYIHTYVHYIYIYIYDSIFKFNHSI